MGELSLVFVDLCSAVRLLDNLASLNQMLAALYFGCAVCVCVCVCVCGYVYVCGCGCGFSDVCDSVLKSGPNVIGWKHGETT